MTNTEAISAVIQQWLSEQNLPKEALEELFCRLKGIPFLPPENRKYCTELYLLTSRIIK